MTPDTLTLNITADDIRLGVPKFGDRCAVAHSAWRAVGPEVSAIHVTQSILWTYSPRDGRRWMAYDLPYAAMKLIGDLIIGKPAEPIKVVAKRLHNF